MSPSPWLTPAQTAQGRFSAATARRRVADGQLPALHLTRVVRRIPAQLLDSTAPPPLPGRAVWTVGQIADLFQVHPRLVHRLLLAGRLHGRRLTTGWRVSRHALSAFIATSATGGV